MNEKTGVAASKRPAVAANPLSGETFWFPGRWLGGVALIAAPLLFLVAQICRSRLLHSAAQPVAFEDSPLAFPWQLAAYEANPALMLVSYGASLAGPILMCPAIMVLVRLIGANSRRWAFWAGTVAIFGIFPGVYWAGVDHFAFQLVEARGLELATQVVAETYTDIAYGPLRIPVTLAFVALVNGVVLALAAYRSGTFGWFRSILLLPGMSAIFMGVLKAASLVGTVGAAGLCIVLVPLGVQVLRGRMPGTAFNSLADRSSREASATLHAAPSGTRTPPS